MRREELIAVFEDTMRLCAEDPALADAVQASISATAFYPAGRTPAPEETGKRKGTVSVTHERSIEAAERLYREGRGRRIAVHNFASATNPGGGVEHGSRAQEESICRITTLFPCLKTELLWKDYYCFHRDLQDVRYTDAVIYTPGVWVVKSDTKPPTVFAAEQRFPVDILTCAAPNLRDVPCNPMNPGSGQSIRLSDAELKEIHVRRAEKLLAVAARHKADCVVLGAFGCGAFRNDPAVVAQAYRETLPRWRECFDEIVFAVYCTPQDSANYETFRRVLTT